MIRILLIGTGAREHALASAMTRSKKPFELYYAGPHKNPGIDEIACEGILCKTTDIEAIVNFAQEKNIDIALPGPEAPLGAGIVDALAAVNIYAFGPTQSMAQLETSKSFTRNILQEYTIKGNPDVQTFNNTEGLRAYIEKLGNVAVKSDGLQGGKGVKVSGDHLQNIDEAYDFAVECIETDGAVVIEEKLEGEEFSYISITDGLTLLHTFAIQDHKRAFEGDTGPNTGGMGTYNDENLSLPFLTEDDIRSAEEINEQVFEALSAKFNTPYVGVMYGGFMKTKQGIQLIEYNARFGDPECQNIMSLWASDFIEFLMHCKNQTLDSYELEFEEQASVVKYLVPMNYPEKTEEVGMVIIPENEENNVNIYYGDCTRAGDDIILGQSRGIAIVGLGDSLAEAEENCESYIQSLEGTFRHRSDIATTELIQKRISHMQEILSL